MHTLKIVTSVIILLSLIIFSSLSAYNSLASASTALDEHIAVIESSAASSDWATAKEQLQAVEKNWSATKKTWSLLIDHVEIDHIDATLSRMGKFIETRNTASALAEAALLRKYIQHIPEKEALNWENIL